MADLIPRLNAALEGRYRIEHLLGEGGMASVYLAEDLHHSRRVALKVLKPELGEAIGPERFEREIATVAALEHPHVVPLLDSGRAGGLLWYTMPYVSGETLAERLEREGALALPDVVRLGREMAEALESAHRRGIVHRDVKPGNVLLSDGHARVADFGIAWVANATEMITRTGVKLGTPAYMSPEHVGGGAVDARSDVYGLGCVLFEMLAGRPPFTGRPEMVLFQHVGALAPNVQLLRPGVPEALAKLVSRCLAKTPAERPATARMVAEELERIDLTAPAVPSHVRPPPQRGRRAVKWAAGALAFAVAVALAMPLVRSRLGGPAVRSIAVLPLVNLSGDPAQEYFADGMTEALINDIARVGTLQVISRTSIMGYKRTKKPLSSIARELGVEVILEGSVVRVGQRTRITIQLVRGAGERTLWSQRYDRDLRDVLALQADVAQNVAREVQLRLSPEQRSRLIRTRRVDPEAHDAFLKGRFYLNRLDEAGYRQALEHFDQALQRDPMHAGAWVGRAQTYYYMSNVYLDPDEAMPRARGAAIRAIELDSTQAEAYAVLGVVLAQYDWDWPGAEVAFRRSLELNPSDATTRLFYGTMLAETGRLEASDFEFRQASFLDPLSLYIATIWIRPEYLGRRYADLDARMEHLLRVDPNYSPTLVLSAMCRLQEGRFSEAISLLERALELADQPFALALLAYGHGRVGHRSEAIAALRKLTAASRISYVSPYTVAWAHIGLDNRDSAFVALERAYTTHDEYLSAIRMDPILDPLRSDARYHDLVRRLRLSD